MSEEKEEYWENSNIEEEDPFIIDFLNDNKVFEMILTNFENYIHYIILLFLSYIGIRTLLLINSLAGS